MKTTKIQSDWPYQCVLITNMYYFENMRPKFAYKAVFGKQI